MKKSKYADKIVDLIEDTLVDLGHSDDFTIGDNLDNDEFSITLEHDASGRHFDYDLAELYHTKEEEDVKVKDQYRDHLKEHIVNFVNHTLEATRQQQEEEDEYDDDEYDDEEYDDDDEYDDEDYDDDDEDYDDEEEAELDGEEEDASEESETFPEKINRLFPNNSFSASEVAFIREKDFGHSIETYSEEQLHTLYRFQYLFQEQFKLIADPNLNTAVMEAAGNLLRSGYSTEHVETTVIREYYNNLRENGRPADTGIVGEMTVSGSAEHPVVTPVEAPKDIKVVSSNDVFPSGLKNDRMPFCVFVTVNEPDPEMEKRITGPVIEQIKEKSGDIALQDLLFIKVSEDTMIGIGGMTPEYLQQFCKDAPFIKDDLADTVYHISDDRLVNVEADRDEERNY